jgi:HSP20 family protein
MTTTQTTEPRSTPREAQGQSLPTLRPRVDVYESEDAFLLFAELPRVAESGVEVTLEQDVLRIEAEQEALPPAGYALKAAEFRPGRFARSFRITDAIDADLIEAKLESGVLRLRLPKSKPVTRKISVATH